MTFGKLDAYMRLGFRHNQWWGKVAHIRTSYGRAVVKTRMWSLGSTGWSVLVKSWYNKIAHLPYHVKIFLPEELLHIASHICRLSRICGTSNDSKTAFKRQLTVERMEKRIRGGGEGGYKQTMSRDNNVPRLLRKSTLSHTFNTLLGTHPIVFLISCFLCLSGEHPANIFLKVVSNKCSKNTTLAQWHRHCDIVTLWHCDIVTLWHRDIVTDPIKIYINLAVTTSQWSIG